MAKQTLDQWIREALTDTEKDGKCTALVLMHIAGMAEKELDAVKLGARQWDVKELASRFRGKAQSYAEGITGRQTFCLYAFYADRSEPQSRKPFIEHGDTEMGENSLGTENPTPGGLTAQAMRHMEGVLSLTMRQTATLFEANNHTVQALLQQNQALMRENRESFEIVKEMLMAQATRTHEHKMEALLFARKTRERNKLLGFAPVLINTILGREVFPESKVDTAIIERIAEDLSEQDLMKLGSSLSGVGIKPEVLGPLAGRMADLLKRKRLENEETDAILNGNGGEDDVIGGPAN